MNLEYRMYEDGDVEGITDLLVKVFGKWSGNNPRVSVEDYWFWKYIENPLSDRLIALCLDEEKIVGCFHGLQMNIKIGKNVYKAVHGADVAVDPNYRRMGVYNNLKKKLTDAESKAGIKFHWGVDSNPILREQAKRRGYLEFPYETHKFVKIYDMNKHIKHLSPSTSQVIGYKTLNFLNTIKNKFTVKNTFHNKEIYCIDRFDEQINSLWNDVKNDYNFIVERRMYYMNWRYFSPKGNLYKVFAASSNGVLQGYLVTKINYRNEHYPVGEMVDLLVRPESSSAAYELLRDGLAFFESQGVNLVLWQSVLGHPYVKVAEYFGIFDSRGPVFFNYTQPSVISEDVTILQESKKGKILFTFGDYDRA
jgi:hypothetical protein